MLSSFGVTNVVLYEPTLASSADAPTGERQPTRKCLSESRSKRTSESLSLASTASGNEQHGRATLSFEPFWTDKRSAVLQHACEFEKLTDLQWQCRFAFDGEFPNNTMLSLGLSSHAGARTFYALSSSATPVRSSNSGSRRARPALERNSSRGGEHSNGSVEEDPVESVCSNGKSVTANLYGEQHEPKRFLTNERSYYAVRWMHSVAATLAKKSNEATRSNPKSLECP